MAVITIIRPDHPYKKLLVHLNIDRYWKDGLEGDEAYLLYAIPDGTYLLEEHNATIIGAATITEKKKLEFSWSHNS
jgi:hypothetical protein